MSFVSHEDSSNSNANTNTPTQQHQSSTTSGSKVYFSENDEVYDIGSGVTLKADQESDSEDENEIDENLEGLIGTYEEYYYDTYRESISSQKSDPPTSSSSSSSSSSSEEPSNVKDEAKNKKRKSAQAKRISKMTNFESILPKMLQDLVGGTKKGVIMETTYFEEMGTAARDTLFLLLRHLDSFPPFKEGMGDLLDSRNCSEFFGLLGDSQVWEPLDVNDELLNEDCLFFLVYHQDTIISFVGREDEVNSVLLRDVTGTYVYRCGSEDPHPTSITEGVIETIQKRRIQKRKFRERLIKNHQRHSSLSSTCTFESNPVFNIDPHRVSQGMQREIEDVLGPLTSIGGGGSNSRPVSTNALKVSHSN